MINNLFKLYSRNRTKTPLEDFTTEAFVGILNYDADIKNSFVSFLKLPPAEYKIQTQVKYELEHDVNCIIDIVLTSDTSICFIENKVDSGEGDRQLERYAKVLAAFNKDEVQTYLCYCTKHFDEKPLDDHQFNQFRWYQIAQLLKPFQNNNALVSDFLNFLKYRKMSQDLQITTKDLLGIENLFETLEIIKGYLERVKPLFVTTFKSDIKISDGFTTSQVIQHKRLIYYFKDIVGNAGWSEIKYGFQTSNSNIYVGIWIDKTNSNFLRFSEFFKEDKHGFQVTNWDHGIAVELKAPLRDFINDENADTQITNWFKESFSIFSAFIPKMQNLDWKINI